jgi:GNAT superfamily N-acetyltransferase
VTLRLEPVGRHRAADLRSVLERASPEARACLCTAAFVESWRDASLAGPCRERLLEEGPPDGFLLYRDGAPIGWCQAAPRDALPLLVRGRGLAPDPDVWAISCLALVPEARGRRLSHDLLRLVLDELRRRGVRRVHAFACRYGEDEDTSTFVEFPESLCRRAGMTLEHDHPMRPIYGLTLA